MSWHRSTEATLMRHLQSSGPSSGTVAWGPLIGYRRARGLHRVPQSAGASSGTAELGTLMGCCSSGTLIGYCRAQDPHRVLQSSGAPHQVLQSSGAPHRVLLPFHGAEQELVEDTAHQEDRPQLKRYFKRVLTSVSKITVKTARSIHL